MEGQIKISVGDSKFAYGTLSGNLDNPLIIFIHGFTGYKDEHIFFNGAKFFAKYNLSTFRFNLYGEEEDARKLNNTPLSLNAKDLDSVIKYFREKGVRRIITIGHSYGALVILLSKNQDFDKVVLWEPSNNPNSITDDAVLLNDKQLYYYNKWGVAFTIGREMFEENKTINPIQLYKQLEIPAKIFLAGNSSLKKYWISESKSSIIIPNATHSFDEEETEEQLFQQTLNWVK